MNKVLCLTSENQLKGNQIPYEYLDEQRWQAMQAIASKLPPRKAERLLMEKFTNEQASQWKERALNDTRYIACMVKQHLDHLYPGQKQHVQVRNGALTAHLRGIWGFAKKNRHNDRHHALDAIVLACSSQSMVQKLSEWNRYGQRDEQKKPRPPLPWPSFREDALAAVEGIFVSRMPVRKITGAAHEDTIRAVRQDADGKRQVIQRTKLTAISNEMLENMVDKERNIRLYHLLKQRLDVYNGDS